MDLGVTWSASGNVLWFMYTRLGGVKSASLVRSGEVCTKIMNMTRLAARAAGLENPGAKLTLLRFRPKPNGPPKLTLKAADSRHYLPLLQKTLEMFFPPTTAREKVLHACVRALANVYKELDNWDPAESPPRLAAQARQHLITYIELRDTADEEFNILWRVLPKHHLFIHIAEATQSTRLCPKLEWCYGDEDEIGRCVKSAKKGNAMHLSTSLLAHYRASFEQ